MADGNVRDLSRILSICLIFVHLSTIQHSTAHPILIQKENFCLLVCPANMPTCDLCRQFLPLLTSKPDMIRRRRDYCQNQCANGLFSFRCGCGHDPTRKRNSPSRPNFDELNAMFGRLTCIQSCAMGHETQDCDCASLREELARRTMESMSYVGPRKPDCASVCAMGLRDPSCRCDFAK